MDAIGLKHPQPHFSHANTSKVLQCAAWKVSPQNSNSLGMQVVQPTRFGFPLYGNSHYTTRSNRSRIPGFHFSVRFSRVLIATRTENCGKDERKLAKICGKVAGPIEPGHSHLSALI